MNVGNVKISDNGESNGGVWYIVGL
jgi:hypothetical protein